MAGGTLGGAHGRNLQRPARAGRGDVRVVPEPEREQRPQRAAQVLAAGDVAVEQGRHGGRVEEALASQRRRRRAASRGQRQQRAAQPRGGGRARSRAWGRGRRRAAAAARRRRAARAWSAGRAARARRAARTRARRRRGSRNGTRISRPCAMPGAVGLGEQVVGEERADVDVLQARDAARRPRSRRSARGRPPAGRRAARPARSSAARAGAEKISLNAWWRSSGARPAPRASRRSLKSRLSRRDELGQRGDQRLGAPAARASAGRAGRRRRSGSRRTARPPPSPESTALTWSAASRAASQYGSAVESPRGSSNVAATAPARPRPRGRRRARGARCRSAGRPARAGQLVERALRRSRRERLQRAAQLARAASAATVPESTPPESRTPTATSASRCARTESRRRSRASAASSRGRLAPHVAGGDGPRPGVALDASRRRPAATRRWPAGSLRASRNIVRGASTALTAR